MSFLLLIIHCKGLETEGIACPCLLFDPITSCCLWRCAPHHWTALIQPVTFPGHAPSCAALPTMVPPAAGEPWGSGRAFPSHPPPCIAGFQREPGDDRPCVSSPWGLPGWPRRLCKGAAGEWCSGESQGHRRGCGSLEHRWSLPQWGCCTGCLRNTARLQMDKASRAETGKNNTVLCFHGWWICLSLVAAWVTLLLCFVFPLYVKHCHNWWKRNERC